MKRFWIVLMLGAWATAAIASAQASDDGRQAAAAARLAEKVRHELVMMPWYGVFDHISFRTDGQTVTLMGAVHRPTLRDEAERRVKAIEGVQAVDNQIRVLPLSPMDDRIRLAAYRTLFSNPMLQRYALGALPAIQIVVDRGTLTLYGTVSSEAERNVAGILASGIPGVFEVRNEIVVAARAEHTRRS